MSAIVLASYDLKRIIRHRPTIIALLALPLIVALARAAFAGSSITLGAAWACPFVCLLLVWAVLHVQRMIDSTTGFTSGLLSTPTPDSHLILARILTGAAIYAAQMVIFWGILALRF
ncbi:MAG: hypothetical protein ABFD54_12590 [Armatimonadota bacterium]|nr:hypothetical protein [bacterium]